MEVLYEVDSPPPLLSYVADVVDVIAGSIRVVVVGTYALFSSDGIA